VITPLVSSNSSYKKPTNKFISETCLVQTLSTSDQRYLFGYTPDGATGKIFSAGKMLHMVEPGATQVYNRQHNDQKKKYKQRSTKHTHKTKNRVTWTPLKTGGELRGCGRVSNSCSTVLSHPLYCLSSCNLWLLITTLVSCGHCIVSLAVIYGFWLPLWYLVAIVLSQQL
jgi:hypothetical protein